MKPKMKCMECGKEVQSVVDGKCQKCFCIDGMVLMTLDGSIEDFNKEKKLKKWVQVQKSVLIE